MKYFEYLESESWKNLRTLAYKRSNNKCEYCGGKAIAVHHIKYPKQFKDDNLDNLIVVCKRCHELNHGLRECDKKNVYLAGTINGIKWKVVKEIPFHNFYSSDSSSNDISFGRHNHDFFDGNCDQRNCFGSMRKEIREYILDETTRTDFLIAIIDKEISFGTIAEIAYFSAMNIPCNLIILNANEKITEAYWLVSNFPNVKTYYTENIEEAANKICEILSIPKELI